MYKKNIIKLQYLILFKKCNVSIYAKCFDAFEFETKLQQKFEFLIILERIHVSHTILQFYQYRTTSILFYFILL